MIAYIFPGQNSQFAGMGRRLAQDSAIAAEVFRIADSQLGYPLSEIMFGEDAEALKPTQVQQPAIFVHSVAAFAALRKRHEAGPAMVAGHSLGEYSALVAAGCIGLPQAVRLVSKRGELMARAADQGKGTMAAIVKLDTDTVDRIVEQASAHGVLAVANYNCPGQIVISGEPQAVAAASDLAKDSGGRAIALKVSGAFHSPLMAPAAAELTPFIDELDIGPPTVPIVSNVDATPRTDPDEIKHALVQQVTGSVRWHDSIRQMIARGVDTFVEVGPGTVLSKMIPRIDKDVVVLNVADMAQVHAACPALC